MKILLSSYHNPNFLNSTVYREKAVQYLGHELISFDDRTFIIPGRIRDKIKYLHQWDLQRINNNLVKAVERARPAVVFVIGGQRILPTTVQRIKKQGFKIVLWTTDPPYDFANILAAAPCYDHLFCGGSEAQDIFHQHGLIHTTLMSFGCDPHYHKIVPLSDEDKKEYAHDISFVGSYYPNREHLFESLADLDIRVWGPYWSHLPEHSVLRSKAVDIKMNYDQWVKIYNASKIVIVAHYQDGKTPCHQVSPKLFEAMACGSFILVDEQKDIRKLFQDGKHLVFFKDTTDLREKVQYYLIHEQERLVIAAEGCREASAKHTYQHRFEKMLRILNILPKE